MSDHAASRIGKIGVFALMVYAVLRVCAGIGRPFVTAVASAAQRGDHTRWLAFMLVIGCYWGGNTLWAARRVRASSGS